MCTMSWAKCEAAPGQDFRHPELTYQHVRDMQPEQAQFVGIFKEEAAEHVQHLHRGLLALKPHPKDEMVLQETARAADTLLGSAMTMGFEGVSRHARTLRDRLFAARDGASPLDTASLEHLLYSLEALCTDVDAT